MAVADVAYTAPAGPRRVRTVIDALLQQLCSSVHRGRYPPVGDTPLCHYQFEVNHSFRDNNGRREPTPADGAALRRRPVTGPVPRPLGVLSGRTSGSSENDYSQSARREPGRSCPPSFSTHSRAGPRCHDCGVELTDLREDSRSRIESSPVAHELVDYSFEQADLTGSRAVEATDDRR